MADLEARLEQVRSRRRIFESAYDVAREVPDAAPAALESAKVYINAIEGVLAQQVRETV